MKKTAIFVVGIPGSGKTSVGQKLTVDIKAKMVEVSDLVKELSSARDRERLQTETHHLDKQIVAKLVDAFVTNNHLVVTGVRQPQIILDFMAHFRRGTVDILQVNLSCSHEQARGRVKDSQQAPLTAKQYEDLLDRDNLLGLKQTLELTLHTPDILDLDESSFPTIESKVDFVTKYIKEKEGDK